RLLTTTDDDPGAALAAVISDGYWERQFARSAAAVGATVRINGLPVAIVGVSPRGFVGATVGAVADITMPFAALPMIVPRDAGLLGPGNFWIRALARPNPELSIAEAETRLTASWPRLAESVISPAWPIARRKA